MDKRVLLTVGICMGILFVWTKFFMPAETPPAQQPPAVTSPAPVATPVTGDGGSVAQAPSQPGTPAQPAGPPPAERPPAVYDRIEQPGHYRADFSTWGGAPSMWLLTNPQFKTTVIASDGKTTVEPINLVRTKSPNLPVTITFPQSEFTVAPDAAWTKLPGGENELNYAYDNDKVHIEKRFTFVPKSYEVRLKVVVENRGDKVAAHHLELAMYGFQDPNVKPGGMFSQRLIVTEGMCDLNGKLKDKDLQSLQKEPIDHLGQVRWVGIDEKYFLSAMAVAQSPEDKRCQVTAAQDGTIRAALLLGERKVEPKAKSEYEFAGFFGPKILDKMDDVKVGGVDAKLGDAINFGWTEAIARPMLAVLKAVYRVMPNWGVAVILLTVLLKIITWWPTAKSMKSMREMAKCKPEIDKLKAKYGDDKQKFNVAVMALYKERGINPLGGCLPMLIQMPIYIALYSMLGNSVELYRSAFVGWIQDLTAPDPYYVLPLLTGVLMFAQQKLSPTPPDAQQKAMMYTMPLMFTAFSIFLPSGLTVYILTNTLLTMAQQWWLNRGDAPLGRPAKPLKA